jgi:uncharacterized lipoprotein YddW (UPF0748 family)
MRGALGRHLARVALGLVLGGLLGDVTRAQGGWLDAGGVRWQTEAPLVTPAAELGELRGIWVDAYGPGFKTPEEIETLVADALAMNLNALFVQVVRRGDCYCNRSTLPRAEDPALAPGFDPLETLIERARAAGLQVHAWVVTLALWGADAPPQNPAHPYNRHGPGATGDARWLTVRYDGVTRPAKDVFLDPGHPAVHDYLAGVVRSLAENYGLDGIAIDRLRYPDFNSGALPSWGYNAVSLARFAAETGAPIPPPPSDPLWTAWRREQVSALMRRLYEEVKAVDPTLWVSAATIAYGAPPEDETDFASSHAYSVVLQDWAGWGQEGVIDLNLPMNYKNADYPQAAAWFEGWNALAPRFVGGAATAIATGLYLNDLPGSMAQLEAVQRTEGVVGWVGYAYRSPERRALSGEVPLASSLATLAYNLTAPGGAFAVPVAFGRPAPSTTAEVVEDAPVAWYAQAEADATEVDGWEVR